MLKSVAIHERLAICFIVMNGSAYLDRNLRRIYEDIAHRCIEYRIEYVENDSTDTTRDILCRYAKEDPTRFNGEMLSLDGVHSEDLCNDSVDHNCRKRTDRLAMLRNIVLKRGMRWREATALLMVDMDFVTFEPEQLYAMSSVFHDVATEDEGEPTQLSAIFGMSVYDGTQSMEPMILYDTGAIRPRHKLVPVWWNTCVMTPTIVRVASAFSGFGLYRMRVLRSTNVEYKRDPDGIEHIAFHRSIPGTLAVYTGFRPVYHKGAFAVAANVVIQYGIVVSIVVVILLSCVTLLARMTSLFVKTRCLPSS